MFPLSFTVDTSAFAMTLHNIQTEVFHLHINITQDFSSVDHWEMGEGSEGMQKSACYNECPSDSHARWLIHILGNTGVECINIKPVDDLHLPIGKAIITTPLLQ